MPPIQGELSPSPPPSPSPAPGKQNNPGASRINQLLDAAMTAPPYQPIADMPNTETPQANSADTRTRGTKRNADYAPDLNGDHPPPPTDEQFPQLDQVTEAANLQAQAKPRRTQTRDPIDKFTRGITTPIHDTFPDAAYEFIAPHTIAEWRALPGEKLLAIPFGSDARNPNLQEEVSNQIFAAVAEPRSCNPPTQRRRDKAEDAPNYLPCV